MKVPQIAEVDAPLHDACDVDVAIGIGGDVLDCLDLVADLHAVAEAAAPDRAAGALVDSADRTVLDGYFWAERIAIAVAIAVAVPIPVAVPSRIAIAIAIAISRGRVTVVVRAYRRRYTRA